MASNITAIYDALAAMSVSFTDLNGSTVTLTGKDLHQLKSSVQASAVPVRLLLPWTDEELVSCTIDEFTIGNEADVIWTILDQLIWRPVGLGIGLEDAAYDLVAYMGAYNDAVLALTFGSITDIITIDGVTIRLRYDIEFPKFSGNFYIGADVIWTIREGDPL